MILADPAQNVMSVRMCLAVACVTDGLICKLCSVCFYNILADPAQKIMSVRICLLLHVLTDGLICKICSVCVYIF